MEVSFDLQPTVETFSSSDSTSTTATPSFMVSSPAGHRLHAHAAEISAKLERKRVKARELDETQNKFSYQPKLVTKNSKFSSTAPFMKSNRYRSSSKNSSSEKACSRLYKDAVLKKKRELARKQAAAMERQSLVKKTFITPDKAESLYERNVAKSKESQAKVERLSNELKPKFTPELVTPKEEREKAQARLYNTDFLLERDEKWQKKREEREGEIYTYTPKLVSKSKVKNEINTNGTKSWERLYSQAKTSLSPKASEPEYTFAPDTSKSKQTFKKSPEDEKSTASQEPIYDRLFKVQVDREARLQEKAAIYKKDQEYSFKPTINAKSKDVTASTGSGARGNRLDELYKKGRDSARKNSLMPKPKKKQVDDEAELTFQPKTNWTNNGKTLSRKLSRKSLNVPRSISMNRPTDDTMSNDTPPSPPRLEEDEEDKEDKDPKIEDLNIDDILDDEPGPTTTVVVAQDVLVTVDPDPTKSEESASPQNDDEDEKKMAQSMVSEDETDEDFDNPKVLEPTESEQIGNILDDEDEEEVAVVPSEKKVEAQEVEMW